MMKTMTTSTTSGPQVDYSTMSQMNEKTPESPIMMLNLQHSVIRDNKSGRESKKKNKIRRELYSKRGTLRGRNKERV